jgi:hypothetical protein
MVWRLALAGRAARRRRDSDLWGAIGVQSEIDDLQWDMIIDRFYARRCVPFLGAGANIARKEPCTKDSPWAVTWPDSSLRD